MKLSRLHPAGFTLTLLCSVAYASMANGSKSNSNSEHMQEPHTARRVTKSVHPLGEIVARLQLSLYLRRIHGLVLGQILCILPLEEFLAVLGVRLAAKVAIRSGLLVLGFSQCKGHSDGPRTAVELDL